MRIEITDSVSIKVNDGPPPGVDCCSECLRWVDENELYETDDFKCRRCRDAADKQND